MKTYHNTSIPGLFILFLFTLAGCKTDSASAPDPVFLKCWTHAFEEESQDGSGIYRPCLTHTFPVARYRNTFTLQENGVVEYSVLAENDAHTTETGKWSYDPKTKKLVITNTANENIASYDVVEIKDDLLRIRE
jgi:hypothetical protein